MMRKIQPLVTLQNSVGNVAASVEAELSTLSEGLKRRQLIAATRSLLELMQDTAHVMNKVCGVIVMHQAQCKATAATSRGSTA